MYSAYDNPYRLWGIGITTDQQLAGAIMKTGGSVFLWAIIIFIFFKRFAAGYKDEHDYRRAGSIPTAEIVGQRRAPAHHRRRRARVRHDRRADTRPSRPTPT